MPNQEYVDWLSEGVEAWNVKRDEQPSNHPDLKGIDIVHLCREKGFVTGEGHPDLSGIDFINTDLRETNLSAGTVLNNADFRTADLRGTILNSADLRCADLRLAKVKGARMLDAKLQNANLRRSQIWKAYLFGKRENGTLQDAANNNAFHNVTNPPIAQLTELIIQVNQIKERYKGDRRISFYFRGEPCNSYPLKPTVIRKAKHQIAEAEMLTELVAHQPTAFDDATSYFGRLVIARHYGLPTRLLDVTRNPLVALHNASVEHQCDNNQCAKPGRIYVFAVPEDIIKRHDSDTLSVVTNFARLTIRQKNLLLGVNPFQRRWADDLEKFRSSPNLRSIDSDYPATLRRFLHFIQEDKPYFDNRIDPRDLFKVFIAEPEQRFDRIRAQSGAFLLSAFHEQFDRTTIRRHVKDVPIFDQYTLSVDFDHKEILIEELEQVNISNSTLLPDLEKAADAIAIRAASRTPKRICQSLDESIGPLRFAEDEGMLPTQINVYAYSAEVTTWIEATKHVLNHLIAIKKLTNDSLPVYFAAGEQQLFVVDNISQFQSETEKVQAQKLGNGMYFNSRGSAETLMENCRALLVKCGVDPENVMVCWEYSK